MNKFIIQNYYEFRMEIQTAQNENANSSEK